jgi:hypothetical protein
MVTVVPGGPAGGETLRASREALAEKAQHFCGEPWAITG